MYVYLPIAEQVHTIWFHRLHVACDNAYQILHFTPKNVSVRQFRVTYFVITFHTLIRNKLYAFFQRRAFSPNFFIR